MNSFYGGRRGISFELVKTYASKNAMLQDFASSSCSVAFGQYVTISSNDSDSGSIYRRTENLANGNSGAILVGQITGKNGINSKIDFIPYSSLDEVFTYIIVPDLIVGTNIEDREYYEVDPTSADGYKRTTDTTVQANKDYYTRSSNTKTLSLDSGTIDFISGKDVQDSINYRTQTTYDEQNNIYQTDYAIQYPYNVIEFETGISEGSSFEIVTNESKPFYQSYTLKIPAVLSGNSVKEIAFITPENFNVYAPIYISPSNKTAIPAAGFTGILAYKLEEHTFEENYLEFSEIQSGNPQELGLYIKVNNNYILTTDTSFQSEVTYYVKQKQEVITTYWYKLCDFAQINIDYDELSCSLILTDKNLQTKVVPLKTISKMDLSNDGKLIAYYIDGNTEPNFILIEDNSQIVGSPKELKLYEKDNENNYILTQDNTVQDKNYYVKSYETFQILNSTNPIKWIKDISTSEDGTVLTITYNTNEQQFFPVPINGIKNLTYNTNGELFVQYTSPHIKQNYNQVTSIETTDVPVQKQWYEISNLYYSSIQEKIQNEEIKNQEEYQSAIEQLIEDFDSNTDFYALTEDEVLISYTYSSSTWYKAYFELGDKIAQPNIQKVGDIRSIERIDYDKINDKIIITYNTLDQALQKETDSFDANLVGIESIEYNDNLDQLIINYTNEQSQSVGLALKVVNVKFDNANRLVFTFNNGTSITTTKSISYPETLQFNENTQKIEMISSSSYIFVLVENPEGNPQELGYYEKNIETDEYFLTTDTSVIIGKDYYNRTFTPDSAKPISPALNYIQDLQINGNNNDVLILFSDPDKKGDIEYHGSTGWTKVGNVRNVSELFIDLNLTVSNTDPNFSTLEKTIETLNIRYPQGYEQDVHSCIAIGTADGNKIIYGFDSDNNTWYKLGKFSTEISVAADTIENYQDGQAYSVSNLPEGGLWFIVEDNEGDIHEGTSFVGTDWEEF